MDEREPKSAAKQRKLGNLGGVRGWQHLDSIGDCKRLIRWTVLSLRNNTLTPMQANAFIQASYALLAACKLADVEADIRALQRRAIALDGASIVRNGSGPLCDPNGRIT